MKISGEQQTSDALPPCNNPGFDLTGGGVGPRVDVEDGENNNFLPKPELQPRIVKSVGFHRMIIIDGE
jgi:hypothetical protein